MRPLDSALASRPGIAVDLADDVVRLQQGADERLAAILNGPDGRQHEHGDGQQGHRNRDHMGKPGEGGWFVIHIYRR